MLLVLKNFETEWTSSEEKKKKEKKKSTRLHEIVEKLGKTTKGHQWSFFTALRAKNKGGRRPGHRPGHQF